MELLLSIGILFVIFSLVNQNYFKQQRNIEFEIARDELKNALVEARENSRNYKNETIYGLKLTASQYFLFKGSSFSATGTLSTTDLPPFLTLEEINLNTTGDEIVFAKNTGNTENYGSFKLTSDENDSAIFTINNIGFISVE